MTEKIRLTIEVEVDEEGREWYEKEHRNTGDAEESWEDLLLAEAYCAWESSRLIHSARLVEMFKEVVFDKEDINDERSA